MAFDVEEWKKQAEVHKRCFSISEDQLAKFKTWNESHLKEKHPNHNCLKEGAIGGRLIWSFTPTNLGHVTTVRCSICEEVFDLSDYEAW